MAAVRYLVTDVNQATAFYKDALGFEIRQQSWKLMAEVADDHPACAKVLEGLFDGLAAGCGRHIALDLKMAAGGKPPFVWSIG